MREVQTRNGKLRRYRTREEICEIIREYQASGLSRWAFCKSRSLSATVFNRWLGQPSSRKTKPAFQEVRVAEMGMAAGSGWAAEVVLTSGVVVRLNGTAPERLTQQLWKLLHG